MTNSQTPIQIRSFLAYVRTGPEPERQIEVPLGPGERRDDWIVRKDGAVNLWFKPRHQTPELSGPGAPDRTLLLGDTAEWEPSESPASMVNGVPIWYDGARRTLRLQTSIVGLPPVFVHRGARGLVLASDLYLIADFPYASLELDPASVAQLGSIGHPTGYRTLFKNTEMIPGGASVTLSAEHGLIVEQGWRLAGSAPTNWKTFIELQIAAFTEAVRRTDVSRSALSLTAGLDTRTVFASLAREGRLVPGVTISGTRLSLDARTARELCRAYHVRHDMVTLGDQFRKDLPRYTEEASRLSGGLESLDQAPEIYFNRQLSREFSARISGNLGNQVGRGGTEGVGVRRASLEVLSPAMRDRSADDSGHWLLHEIEGDETTALSFILQQEIPFSSVGNFCVGSHFAVQQSPYASRCLLETLPLKPRGNASAPSSSLLHMRLRDLKHRFMGEPSRISFQRSLVTRIGGVAARYPINYGWRATGGFSLPGVALGLGTLVGMLVQKKGLEDWPGGSLLTRSGIPALHNFRQSGHWLLGIEDFVRATLQSRDIRDSDMFDQTRLASLVDEHFSRSRNHHETITFALDLALAFRLFCARLK